MNKHRVVDVYVEHLDSKLVHCTRKQTRIVFVNISAHILNMPDSDDDRDANSDYEDENEGPLVDISDMLAIDEIDVGMVYGLESFKSDWEQAGVETLEGPSVAMLDVTKNNESSSSKVKSVSFGVNKMDLPQDIVHGEPDGNMAIDSEGEDFNRYIIVPKYDEFNKDTDMVNTITSTLKRAIIEVAIKEGIEVRFSKNNSTQVGAKCEEGVVFFSIFFQD